MNDLSRSSHTEFVALSSNVADPVILAPPEERPALSGPAAPAGRIPPLAVALIPALAAVGAMVIDQRLPTLQELPPSWMDSIPTWKHPYSLLLDAIVLASLIAALVQGLGAPLRAWVRHYAPLLAGATLLTCLWNLITAKLAWLPQPYFPGPDEVLGGLIEDRVLLAESTWHSLRLLAFGYAGGVALGLITGVSIGWSPRIRYWVMPMLKFIGPIPATAMVPLVMMMPVREYLFLSGAALIAFSVWFPVTMLTSSGIANVRLSYLDVAKTLGAGRLYLILRVAIPAAMPHIFVGLFMGLVVSFLALMAAETLGVRAGLGWYVGMQKGYADYAKVYASLFIISVFCSTIMTLLFKTRDYVLKWQKGVIKW
jgi:NitT/TauT family transport system permease protein